MNKYVEITLLNDADIDLYFLWEKLYAQLHLAFVETVNDNGLVSVGVSFPKYRDGNKPWLGDKIRIFAESEGELNNLNLDKWLDRLTDYIHVKKVKDVPEKVNGYAFFKRLNDKSNQEKLARRRAKNLDISIEEARVFFADQDNRQQPKRQLTHYPYISTLSLHSDSKYPMTVVREETTEAVFNGGFSTYGFSVKREGTSGDSAVPLF